MTTRCARRPVAAVAVTVLAVVAILLPALASAGPAEQSRTPRVSTTLARPFTASPTYSTLNAGNEYEELWAITLRDGQQVIVKMFPSSGEDLDLALWGPGTTEVTTHGGALERSWRYGDVPEAIRYVVPAGAGGTYFIDVWSSDAPAGGYYWFTVDVQSPGGRAAVTPPAVKKNLRTGRWYTAYGTLRPLHFAGDRTVKLVWQKYSGKRWRAAGSDRPENIDYRGYSRFRVKFKFYGWGKGTTKWRVRTIHLRDQMHPRRASAWRYFSVRN